MVVGFQVEKKLWQLKPKYTARDKLRIENFNLIWTELNYKINSCKEIE